MWNLVKENKVYLVCLAAYCLVASLFLILFPKGTEILYFSQHRSQLANIFFKYITFLGDGYFVLILIIFFFLFKSIRTGLYLSVGILVTFLIVQGLKLYVYAEQVRPLKYFEGREPLLLVEGVDVHSYHSFPSGHSAQAFGLALLLSLTFKNKLYSPLFFLIALLVAISRMYLAQHFMADTLAGMVIATGVCVTVFYILSNRYKALSSPIYQQGLIGFLNK